jgi:hydrogenase maturation factor
MGGKPMRPFVMRGHNFLNGALTCARYAFAPNFFHYCGPDTRGEFGEYVAAETADGGLTEHLQQFETMYPYLNIIAHANAIADPLDTRVVEAYWVGNRLLERVDETHMHMGLVQELGLPKRIGARDMQGILPKIGRGARLHHSFHVFNVFIRTGHHTVEHTVETMDECRIGWGKIASRLPMTDHRLQIQSQKLVYKNGQLKLVSAVLDVEVPGDLMTKRLNHGDWVSVHWGFVCDVLSPTQVKRLERYTKYHLTLANETL